MNMLTCQASPLAHQDPFLTGRKALAAGNYRQAATWFETAMRLNPAHSSALYYDALAYQNLGELEHARALYLHAINIFPRSTAAKAAQVALSKLGTTTTKQTAATAQHTASAAGAAPSDIATEIDADLQKASGLISSNRQTEAERVYIECERSAEHLGPRSQKLAQVLAALGDFYSSRGRPDRAVSLYRRELQIKENALGRNSEELADCMVRQAPAYDACGQIDQAEKLYQRSLETYQNKYRSSERNHVNSKPNRDKLVGCMAGLAAVLRKENRVSEAKQLEYQVKLLSGS